jgi:hypothetical protein
MSFEKRLTAPILGSVLVVLLGAPPALADKAACGKAYTQAQVQKKAGKLREAKKNLLVCAQKSCPGFINSECAKWLNDVESTLPTIVIAASDAKGNDLTDVSVSSDGQQLADKLGGMALEVDPGKHTLRFEHAGAEPVEKKVLIREGEKARVIKVQFGSPEEAAAAQPKQGAASGGGAAGVDTSSGGSSKTLAYVLGGVGIVGLGSFAYFGLTGSSQKSDLLKHCKNNVCDLPQDQIDSKRSAVKTKFLIADVSLGVGVVSLGLATYFFLKPDHSSEAPKDSARLRFDVAPTHGGSYATVSGKF